MGRRSIHTPEQLRLLILDAAQAIIEAHGLAGLSAREIARRIEYSPGTIYNMYDNLDDVVLHVEARVLDALNERLAVAVGQPGETPEHRIGALAQAYLQFTHERPKLWNLLFEHYMTGGAEPPDWYRDKLSDLLVHVEAALEPFFLPGQEDARRRSARVLWAGVHGITSLATADKLSTVTTETAGALVDDLVATYLRGLRQSLLQPGQLSQG